MAKPLVQVEQNNNFQPRPNVRPNVNVDVPNNIRDFNPNGLRHRNNDTPISLLPIECIPGHLRVLLPTGTVECVIDLKNIFKERKKDPITQLDISKEWVERINNWPVSEDDQNLWNGIDSANPNEKEQITHFRENVAELKNFASSLASLEDPSSVTASQLQEKFNKHLSKLSEPEQKFVNQLILFTDKSGKELTVEQAFTSPFTDHLNKEKIQFLALSLWVLSSRLEPDPSTLDEKELTLLDTTVPKGIRLCAKDLNCDMSAWFPEGK